MTPSLIRPPVLRRPCIGCGRYMTKPTQYSQHQWATRKYCTPQCAARSRRGVPLTVDHRRKVAAARKGKRLSPYQRSQIQQAVARNAQLTREGWLEDGGVRVGYRSAHGRVIAVRGPASNQECEHCGAEAFDWAYDHQDPNAWSTESGRMYSGNPAHYFPLCRRCHIIFDRRQARS